MKASGNDRRDSLECVTRVAGTGKVTVPSSRGEKMPPPRRKWSVH